MVSSREYWVLLPVKIRETKEDDEHLSFDFQSLAFDEVTHSAMLEEYDSASEAIDDLDFLNAYFQSGGTI